MDILLYMSAIINKINTNNTINMRNSPSGLFFNICEAAKIQRTENSRLKFLNVYHLIFEILKKISWYIEEKQACLGRKGRMCANR